MQGYLGIDVGSVSTKVVFLSTKWEVLFDIYLRTLGNPVEAVRKGMAELKKSLPDAEVLAAGTTGSGRQLAGVMVGADSVKNEITAHAVAALQEVPGVRTILEIGGQDSKIILLRGGVVTDFAMNTVCAAGTGSFLDRQAARLGFPIEQFGELALQAKNPVRIAGRCAVFAESDMVHKQQIGHPVPDIVAGLCEALVRNYLNNVGKGKEILAPVAFQGGVAANAGIRAAFAKQLGKEIHVPCHYQVMGAIGAAMLAAEEIRKHGRTRFLGFETLEASFSTGGFECTGCPNRCEVVEFRRDGHVVGRLGDRCGKWSLATGAVAV